MFQTKPNYGIDAPGLLRGFLVAALGCLLIGSIIFVLFAAQAWVIMAASVLGLATCYFFGMACFMFYESRVGKVFGREVILDLVSWRGDEHVLDVGCGRGLMLVGAAMRLSTGRAIGIDIWQARDQSDNSPDAARLNARLEGVETRIEVRTADMRRMPFDDAKFDIVFSHWVVHNLDSASDRAVTLAEINRVLKPGGSLLLTDIALRSEYLTVLRSLSMEIGMIQVRPLRDIILAALTFGSFRPATIVARKAI